MVDSFRSSSSSNKTPHVVIVMDALKKFSIEPLLWALENNILAAGHTVTLLGTIPWLNLPISPKTLDVWKETPEMLRVVELCNRFGVVLEKLVVMGHPERLVVLEKIVSLHATWVIFDRNQKKNKEFYAERIPCNMVVMNENGVADMIRGQSMI